MDDLSNWLENFRELHGRARKHLLTTEEREHYMEAREQLARTLLVAQGQNVPPGAPARRNFRVPKGLPVDVSLPSGPERSRTVDLSSGGLSCTLSNAPMREAHCGLVLWLPKEESPLVGRARVVTLTAVAGGAVRASFAFTDMSEVDRERLEMMLFDLALNYVLGWPHPAAQPPGAP